MVSVDSTFQWPEPLPVSDAEHNILVPPPKPSMLDWARENFSLPENTSLLSWSDEYTPWVRRPLALLDKHGSSVWVSACTQIGKSVLVMIVTAYICEVDPCGLGMVLPQEGDTKKRIRTKIRPLFRANPSLYQKIRNDIRNINIGEETDLGDMILFPIWSTSSNKMRDSSIPFMIYDEVSEFKLLPNGEHPIADCRNRQTSFEEIRRELGVSSPMNSGDVFDKEMRSGTDEQWYTPCMKCGRWHKLLTYVDKNQENYLVVDTDSDGQYFHHTVYKSGNHSRYVCPLCKNAWSEADRWRSNKAGVWVPSCQTMDPNGKISGDDPVIDKFSFNVHAMMAYYKFGSMGALAAEFVEAKEEYKKGDKSKLQNWQRNKRNLPWKEEIKVVDSHKLEEKKTDRKSGIVPVTAKLLTAGADFHKDSMGNVRVDYIIKAWSDDLRDDDILFGHAKSLDEMFRITTSKTFPWAEKTDRPPLRVSCGFVDSGYQPNDPSEDVIDEVYQFCRKYWRYGKIWYPIRGGKPSQVELFKPSKLDEVVERSHQAYRRRTARQYRGMVLYTLAVYQFKNKVIESAEAPLGTAGSTSYPADFPALFFEQLTNEYKGYNEKGKWGWWIKEPHLASHSLDVSGYARAAGHFKGIDQMWSEEELKQIEAAMADMNMQTQRPVRRIGRVQRR